MPAGRERVGFIERFLEWALSKIEDRRLVDGLLIIGREKELDRVAAALCLISLCDPARYRQIRRHVERIRVGVLFGNHGQFRKSTWTCYLEERFVLDEETTPDLIASVIVHEATHARLLRLGFGYDEAIRERIEQICIRREIAFALTLPNGQRAVEEAEHVLKSLPDLSDAAWHERRMQGGAESLRYLGVPEPIIRFVIVTGAWLHRVRRVRGARKEA